MSRLTSKPRGANVHFEICDFKSGPCVTSIFVISCIIYNYIARVISRVGNIVLDPWPQAPHYYYYCYYYCYYYYYYYYYIIIIIIISIIAIIIIIIIAIIVIFRTYSNALYCSLVKSQVVKLDTTIDI